MITQWNEWTAQRAVVEAGGPGQEFLGKPLAVGQSYLVDTYNQEFNRDIEPMEGGHTDNHYYLMVDRIRKFKGLPVPQPPSPAMIIAIDGAFAEWAKVPTVFNDPLGDVVHRDLVRYDGLGQNTNTTGRNDIVESRATWEASQVAFYVKTASTRTLHTDINWRLVFQ